VNKILLNLVIPFLAVFIATGCGEPGPKLVKAGGTVKLKGAPVEGATVTLIYPDGNNAVGITDAQGVFDLAYNGRPGTLPAQKVKVIVTKLKGEAAAAKKGPPKDIMDPTKMMAEHFKDQFGNKAPTASTGPTNELPEKYANPETSGLVVDVLASGENNFSFNLTD
jgi:hypothetical protein